MNVKRPGEALNELAEEIRKVQIPDAPAIRQAFVEPYVDADGEAALKAVIILDKPDTDGWPAEFTHALRREANRLATRHHLDEHVYVTLFTQEEFEARENPDEPAEDNNTGTIDQALTRDQQDRP